MRSVVSYIYKNLLGIVIILLLGAGVAKELWGTALTLGTKRVTYIADSATSNDPLSSLATEYYLQNLFTSLELSGGNAGEIYNVRDYGAIPNVTFPASGSTFGGTNQYTAIKAAVDAAPSGAIVFIGAGNWLLTTTVTFTTKQVNFLIVGNIYSNGVTPFSFNAPGGQDRGHIFVCTGKIVGRNNIPSNSVTTRAAGTSPQWNTFTGSGVKLGTNCNNMYIKVRWVEGYRYGIEVQGGGATSGVSGGTQESSIEFLRLHYNAVGIAFTSTNGMGWLDKTTVRGFGGGYGRVSGGLAFEANGYSSPAASNGEVYNQAFRSNEIQFLAELVDSLILIRGDFTYNRIKFIAEGGTTTGVLGAESTAIIIRTSSPNPAFHNFFQWNGALGVGKLANGLGLGGEFEGDVWNGGSYIGNRGRMDGSGNLIIYVEPNLAASTRNALPANIKCVNMPIDKVKRTITVPTYTTVAADAEGIIQLNSNPMVLTLGPANQNVDVTIRIKNINANNATLFNLQNKATLAQDEEVDAYSDGSVWIALSSGTSYTPGL